MMRARGNWLFPVVLAVVLGGVSFWLDQVTDVKSIEAQLNPQEPRYVLTGIRGEIFDKDGNIGQTLQATEARQYPGQTVIRIADPVLNLFEQGQPLYRLTGLRALYDSDSKQVRIEDNVVWHKNATPKEPEALVQTDWLQADTVAQTVKTDAPVIYSYGLSHGTAVGFSYDKSRGFLNLSSRVKAVIYENKKP